MRRLILFGALIVILVLVGWWFLLMAPKSSEIADFNDQRDALELEESTLQGRLGALEDLAAKEGDFAVGLNQLRTSIPVFPSGAALIDEINQIANDAEIELRVFNPSPPVPSQTVPGTFEISSTIAFEAPYFRALAFLFELEQLERLVRIDQISVSSVTDEGGETILVVDLTTSAFSLTDLIGSTATGEES